MDLISFHLNSFIFTFQFKETFFKSCQKLKFQSSLLLDKASIEDLIVNVYTAPDKSLEHETFGNGFCGYIIPLQLDDINSGKPAQPIQKMMTNELKLRLQTFWEKEDNKKKCVSKVEGMLRVLHNYTSESLEPCHLQREFWLTDGDVLDVCKEKNICIFAPSTLKYMKCKTNDSQQITELLRLQCFDSSYGCLFSTIAKMLDNNYKNAAVFNSHFQFLPINSMPKKNDLLTTLVKQIKLNELKMNYADLFISSENTIPRGWPNRNYFCCTNAAINMITQIYYEAKKEFKIEIADCFSECARYTVSEQSDAEELLMYLYEKFTVPEDKIEYIQTYQYCEYVRDKININETISGNVEVIAIAYPSIQSSEIDAVPLLYLNNFGLVGFFTFTQATDKVSKVGEYLIVRGGHYVSYRFYKSKWYLLNDLQMKEIEMEMVVNIFMSTIERQNIICCVYNKDESNRNLLIECEKSCSEKRNENYTNKRRKKRS
jgi:hypothetical protein